MYLQTNHEVHQVAEMLSRVHLPARMTTNRTLPLLFIKANAIGASLDHINLCCKQKQQSEFATTRNSSLL